MQWGGRRDVLRAGTGGRLHYVRYGYGGLIEISVRQLGHQVVVLLLQSKCSTLLGLQSGLHVVEPGSQAALAIFGVEGGGVRHGDGGEVGGVLAFEHLSEDFGSGGGLSIIVQTDGILLGRGEGAAVRGGFSGVQGVAESLVLLAGGGGGLCAELFDGGGADLEGDVATLAVHGDELEGVVGLELRGGAFLAKRHVVVRRVGLETGRGGKERK